MVVIILLGPMTVYTAGAQQGNASWVICVPHTLVEITSQEAFIIQELLPLAGLCFPGKE